MRGMGAAGREWERGERAGARELLQPWAGKGFNQGWPCLEGGYSFKMRVTFPEDGWEQGRGKSQPQAGSVWESRGRHKNAAGDVQKLKILRPKALLLLRGRSQQMSTQNCPNLSQRESKKVT